MAEYEPKMGNKVTVQAMDSKDIHSCFVLEVTRPQIPVHDLKGIFRFRPEMGLDMNQGFECLTIEELRCVPFCRGGLQIHLTPGDFQSDSLL